MNTLIIKGLLITGVLAQISPVDSIENEKGNDIINNRNGFQVIKDEVLADESSLSMESSPTMTLHNGFQVTPNNSATISGTAIIVIIFSILGLIAFLVVGFYAYKFMSIKRMDLPTSKNNSKEISQLKKLYGPGMQKSDSNATLTELSGFGRNSSSTPGGKFGSKDYYEVGKLKKLGSLQDVNYVMEVDGGRK